MSLIIVFIAACLRLYKLGDVPHGMTWDEAAIGYNGYAIFHTRRDEWLNKLPVSFKSFGDYKSPLAIYINGPFTFLFGMNLWAVRLPFALAGILSVAGVIFLVYLISKHTLTDHYARILGLGAGLLMALSPWHIHFSRIGFESGLALCFLIWGVALFLHFLDLRNSKKRINADLLYLVGAVIFLAASLYTYHSAKIVTPLIVLTLAISYWQSVKAKFSSLLGAAIGGVLLLFPLLKDTFLGSGGNRFSQATLFGQHLNSFQLLSSLFTHFVIHFSPAYLILGQTVTLRHGDGHWGILYVTDLFLVLAGLCFLILKKKATHTRELLLGLLWVIIGTLPAVIGTDVPHGNRAFLALPGFILLAVFGTKELLSWLSTTQLDRKLSGSKGETHLLVKAVIGLIILFHAFFAMSYVHDYYTTFAKDSATDFQDGFIQAFQFAVKNEPNVDQILISDSYGQAYIFALFVRHTNPIWYQGGIMVKYVYLPKLSEGDLSRKNVVLIAPPSQIPPEKGDELVYGSDGKVKFVLVRTK